MMYDYRKLFILSIEWFIHVFNVELNKELTCILDEYKNVQNMYESII